MKEKIFIISFRLKTGAMANTLNATEISNYKQQLIRLIEEMYSVQHTIVQKQKDSKPQEHLKNSKLKRFKSVQDILAENIEGKMLNENRSDHKDTGNDYNDIWNYVTTSGHLYGQNENLQDLEELNDTREVDVEPKYIHKSYDKLSSKQKTLKHEKIKPLKKVILKKLKSTDIEQRINSSQTTRSYLLSKLKKRLQSLQHIFHISFKDKHNQQYYDKNDSDSTYCHLELTESSKRDCQENESASNKQQTIKSSGCETTWKITSNKGNDQNIIKKIGVDTGRHRVEDFSDMKHLNNNEMIGNFKYVNDHKYADKKLNMIINNKYKRKYLNNLKMPHEIHQEIASLANDTPNINGNSPKTYKYEKVLPSLDEYSASNENYNYYTIENDDYLLEEVDDKLLDYHDDYAIDDESARKISNHDTEIQPEEKESTAFSKKDLLEKNHEIGNDKVAKKSMKKGIKIRLTKNIDHEVLDKSTLKTQFSTGVVLLVNSKPLLRKTRPEGESKSPHETVAAIGLSILCLATFLSLLAVVLLITKFLLNNPQGKNKFAFYAR